MNQMKRHLGITAVMTAWIMAFTLLSTPVRAEEKTDKSSSNMEILREKIKADKKLVVAANLDLTDAEAKAFWPIYQEYQTKLVKINERIAKLIVEYAENYKSMTNDIAKKLMKESMAVEKERLILKESLMPKFQKALPAIKAARYYQIENKIQAVVQYGLADSIPLVE
ncbi:MAG: hypothetical protein V1844_17800 [Pseudomonadota bacterium]